MKPNSQQRLSDQVSANTAYVNTDRGQGTQCPRRIQVDAPKRMVTAERTSCYAELADRQKRAADLMGNAIALPTTPQHINHKALKVVGKKRPHDVVGPRGGGHHHSSASMIVR